jgi:LPPG:FO 2-phospho-L-lactate transferase
VAVSPIVDGAVLKGPTAAFMQWAGQPLSAAGIAALYGDLLDGLVCDEEPKGLPVAALQTSTLMSDASGRERVARAVLGFAEGLAA